MTPLAYPYSALLSDYARAGIGLVIVGVPLAFVDTGPAVTAALAACAFVFLAYAVRTIRLHRLRIAVDGEEVRALGPAGPRIPWRELRGVRLAYYSTRRDNHDGWLQLTLVGAGARLRVDSRIDGFDALAARAVSAAAANGVALDAATAVNLDVLGIPAPDARAASVLP